MRAQDREAGSVMPLVLGGVMLLAVLAFGGATVARMVLARNEAQRAADAACLTAANVIKHEGLPFNGDKQGRAEEVARGNSALPVTLVWEAQETPTAFSFRCTARIAVPAPRLVWSDGVVNIEAHARAQARQQTITEAEKKYPQLVIVLDYSGSMQRNFAGNINNDRSDDSFWDLMDAANALLDKDFDFRYGLVIFATGVLDTTPNVSLDNLADVKTRVNTQQGCPYQGLNGCGTGTSVALDRARDLLKDPALPDDEGKFVLVVSDGQPSSAPAAVAAANHIWDLGAEIFTIQITNDASSGTTLKQFMHSISGTPEHRGDPAGHYWSADDPATLEGLFVMFGNALACQLPVVDPAPPDPDKMHVFVRDAAGNETQLGNAAKHEPEPADEPGDLWDSTLPFRDGNYFYYHPEKKRLFVTPDVCARILDEKQSVYVRFKSPQLSE